MHFAANLHRLIAEQGLTLREVSDRTGVDERTLKAILKGDNRPQPRTLHRLAEGLGVAIEEFFQDPALLARRAFDRQTNPAVDEVIQDFPDLFAGWHQADYDELYSRFGHGGALTPDGARQVVEAMNAHREVHRQVAMLLESDDSQLLTEFVAMLYKRNVIRPENRTSAS